jgi:tetratricopeptide (TPR) repeat protein
VSKRTHLAQLEELSGEEWLARGDELRVRHYKPRHAIECYKKALGSDELSSDQRRYAFQMIGVCCNMLHDTAEAKRWFNSALKGAFGVKRANTLRDMGYSYTLTGMYDDAEKCLQRSLELLREVTNPVEIGATYGFVARNLSDQGKYIDANVYYVKADALLFSRNKALALYNRLHWASTLSRAGRHRKSRALARSCYQLAGEHGARAHKARAVALYVGGWRAEKLMSRISRKN